MVLASTPQHPRQVTVTDPVRESAVDLVEAVPDDLRRALPAVAPAVLFTAWSLARHGRTARDLSRVLTLTGEQSRVITTHLRPPPADRDAGGGPPSDDEQD